LSQIRIRVLIQRRQLLKLISLTLFSDDSKGILLSIDQGLLSLGLSNFSELRVACGGCSDPWQHLRVSLVRISSDCNEAWLLGDLLVEVPVGLKLLQPLLLFRV